MKNLVIILASVLIASCASQKPQIDGLAYGVNFGQKTSQNLNFEVECPVIFDEMYYCKNDMSLLPWEDSHYLIGSSSTIPDKVYSDDRLVPVKCRDKNGDYIDIVEIGETKARITKGKNIRYHVVRLTDSDIEYSLPVIRWGDKEYFIFELSKKEVYDATGIMPKRDVTIGLTPFDKTSIDIKNGCRNISLVTSENVWIYLSESLLRKDDILLYGSVEGARLSSSDDKDRPVAQKSETVKESGSEQKISEFRYHNSSTTIEKFSITVCKSKKNGNIFLKAQKGDGLYSIAKRAGISLKEIIRLNPKIAKRESMQVYLGELVRIH